MANGYLRAYRSQLGAAIEDEVNISDPGERERKINSMPTEEMLAICMSNPKLWRNWHNMKDGQVYPPGDPRNPPRST